MPPNSFSCAGRAAQLREAIPKKTEKIVKSTRYDGVPAKTRAARQFERGQDYILHKECIWRVARQVFRVYNF